MKKKFNLIIVITFLMFLIWSSNVMLQLCHYFLIMNNMFSNQHIATHFTIKDADTSIELKPNCECTNETRTNLIHLKKDQNNIIIKMKNNFNYNISVNQLEESFFTCDLYSTFEHGPHQKVISYSLYNVNGNTNVYLKDLIQIINTIRVVYPGWIVRVYHDSTVNKSLICQLQCKYERLVNFCDIQNLPLNFYNLKWSAKFMHAMTWRWFDFYFSFFVSFILFCLFFI
jgi:hypothetical protein